MYERLINWPKGADAQVNIPSCLKDAFQDKTTLIIDCFKVFIETPESLLT